MNNPNPQPNQNPNQPQGNQIQLKADDAILRGAYANLVQVNHTKEEFVFDFINAFPPMATLNSRIILSPAHVKRLVGLLNNVMKQYEEANGPVEAASEPEGIGFSTK